MIKFKLFIAIVAGLSISQPELLSQAEQALFTQLTTNEGLSSNTVTAIHQDNHGYMWFQTSQGLDRYDGIEFFNYHTTSERSTELGYCITEDSLGNLWYGADLTTYDQAVNTSYQHNFYQQGEQVGIQNIMNIILGPDHFLYLATGNNILLIDPYTPVSTLETLFIEESALPFRRITKIRFDQHGRLWIASDEGLYRYQPGMESPVHLDGLEYREMGNLRDFLFDREGNLWAVFTHDLIKYDFRRNNTENFHIPGEDQTISNTLYQTENGTIWLGTSESLLYLEPGQDRFKCLLDHPDITAICEDRSRRLWIGTEESGVYLYDPLHNAFKQFLIETGGQSLTSFHVNRIINDDGNGFWISTRSLGLLYYSLSTGNTSIIKQENNNGDILYRDREGNLWCQSQDHLLCYDANKGFMRKIRYPAPLQFSALSEENIINNMCAFGEKLILCSDYGDVYTLNPVTEKFSLILQHRAPVRIMMPEVDTLLLGLYNAGVVLMDHTFQIIDTLYHDDDQQGIKYHAVMTMHRDRYDTLWIGGYGGISRLKPQAGRFESVFDFHGSGGQIVSILEDRHGNLWLGTSNGICKYDRRSGRFSLMDSNQGMPAGRFFSGCAVQTPDGEMFFGGNNGIVHFHPDEVRMNAEVPQVVLTGFYVNAGDIQDSSVHKQDHYSMLRRQKKIDLKHWQNSFTIKYAALNYTSPQHNQYQYRLLGLEEEWKMVGNQTSATYSDLRGGDYLFQIKGSNNDGVWNNEASSFTINIAPPPARSWWAFSLYALLLMALTLAVYFYNIRRIRLQHQLEIKSKEAEGLQEIDRAKSQFFANISHEFRTPLSLIMDPAEQLQQDEELKPRQREYINLILNSSRRLQFLTNQILDLTKLTDNRITLKVENVDIVSFIAPIAHAFHSKAEALSMDYTLSLPDRPLMVWIDKERVDQIVVNLLANAFKFCPPGGEIVIKIVEEQDSVLIQVKDSGIGIPADQINHIFEKYYQVETPYTRDMAGTGIGLFLVREFVKLHQGSVEVKSEVEKGSTFSVRFSKGHSHFQPEQLVAGALPEEEGALPAREDNAPSLKGSKLLQSQLLPTLLLIEDNPEMVQYLADVLSDEYYIHIAMNGKEGFQKTVEINPEVVISDVMMPLMDGYRLCETVKKDARTSHIPVILLTAKEMHKDKIEGLKLGADDYLQKPFHLDELKLRIRYHLERRKQIQEEFLNKFRINAETDFALSVKDQFLQKVFSSIEEHLSDDQFGVEKLSNLMGMSRKHINHKIKTLTSQTPNELIRSFRLRRAAFLLSEKGISVTEACYQVGFNNLSYFSKCFAEFYGKRPSEYHG